MANITDIMMEIAAEERRYIRDVEEVMKKEATLEAFLMDHQKIKLETKKCRIKLPKEDRRMFSEAISEINNCIKDTSIETDLIKKIKDEALLYKLQQNRSFQILAEL